MNGDTAEQNAFEHRTDPEPGSTSREDDRNTVRKGSAMMSEKPIPPDDDQDPPEVTPPDDAEEEETNEEHRPTIEPDDAKPTEDPGLFTDLTS